MKHSPSLRIRGEGGITMRKQTLALCVAGLLAAVLAGGAAAEKPIREPSTPPTFELPAGVACSFALRGEPVESKQTETTYASGKLKITGHFVGRLTNLDNGKSITVKASGSVRLIARGRQLPARERRAGDLLVVPGRRRARRRLHRSHVPHARAHRGADRPGDLHVPLVRDEAGRSPTSAPSSPDGCFEAARPRRARRLPVRVGDRRRRRTPSP